MPIQKCRLFALLNDAALIAIYSPMQIATITGFLDSHKLLA